MAFNGERIVWQKVSITPYVYLPVKQQTNMDMFYQIIICTSYLNWLSYSEKSCCLTATNYHNVGIKSSPGWESMGDVTAVAGQMKFPHSDLMWVKSVLQLCPAVFISCVNDCPACRHCTCDTVMLSDRLIYLLVSPPHVSPPFSLYLKAFRSSLIFFQSQSKFPVGFSSTSE